MHFLVIGKIKFCIDLIIFSLIPYIIRKVFLQSFCSILLHYNLCINDSVYITHEDKQYNVHVIHLHGHPHLRYIFLCMSFRRFSYCTQPPSNVSMS